MKRTIIRLAAGLAAATMALGIAAPAFADYDHGTEHMSASGWHSEDHQQGQSPGNVFTFHVTGSNISCNVNSVNLDFVHDGGNVAQYATAVSVTRSWFRVGSRWACLGSFDTTVSFRQGTVVGSAKWGVTMSSANNSANNFVHERDITA